MNKIKTLLAIAAASLTFGATSASAATCDVGSCIVVGADGQNLSDGVLFNLFNIENEVGGVNDGTFNFFGNFINTSAGLASAAVTVLQFAPSTLGSIGDLALTIFAPASVSPQTFALTDSLGAAINPVGNDVVVALDLSAAPGETIWFELQGVALPGGPNGDANPSLTVSIEAVPVPAAGLLLLAGLGGLGAMKRRKKA